MLELKTYFYKHILVSEIQGPLNSRYASDFKTWYLEQIKKGYKHIAFDLLEVEYLSSMGITTLVEINEISKKSKGQIVFFNLGSEVKRLLKFLKLDNILSIENSAEGAIQKLQKSGNYKILHSIRKQESTEEPKSIFKVMVCPHCKEKIKIAKTGRYLCPHCEKKLKYLCR